MVGIERIHIISQMSGQGIWRFVWSKRRWTAANKLYHDIFAGLGMPLLPGHEDTECTLDEFKAGYDHELGIDVLLRHANGMIATLQEKFLSYHKSTITVEYMQNPATGEQGDWFNLKCQYYFVGYDRNDSLTFDDWILVDWPALMRATQQGQVRWYIKPNTRDGAKANFKFAYFDGIPPGCVIDRLNKEPQIRLFA